jgi:hypothetical protein
MGYLTEILHRAMPRHRRYDRIWRLVPERSVCGVQGFEDMPLRDERLASPVSLDILMNVFMHMTPI